VRRGVEVSIVAAKCLLFYKTSWLCNSEDVRAVVHDVLRHKGGITYEAEAENIAVNINKS
jgi:MoxR-like ATPase